MSTPDQFERLLVAIPLPMSASDTLAGLQEEDIHGFRWSNPETLHLTLRIIGEVDLPLKEAIQKALATIEVEPFILPLEGLGIFPPKGQPQVVWAGVGNAHPRLFQLQHRIEDAMAALGLPLELRNFSPHITIARTSHATHTVVAEYLKRRRDFIGPDFKVDSFALYKTQMTHFGPLYTLEADYPLRQNRKTAQG